MGPEKDDDREDARHRRLKILILVVKAGIGILLFSMIWSYRISPT